MQATATVNLAAFTSEELDAFMELVKKARIENNAPAASPPVTAASPTAEPKKRGRKPTKQNNRTIPQGYSAWKVVNGNRFHTSGRVEAILVSRGSRNNETGKYSKNTYRVRLLTKAGTWLDLGEAAGTAGAAAKASSAHQKEYGCVLSDVDCPLVQTAKGRFFEGKPLADKLAQEAGFADYNAVRKEARKPRASKKTIALRDAINAQAWPETARNNRVAA